MTGNLACLISSVTTSDLSAGGYSLDQIFDNYRNNKGAYANHPGYQSNAGMIAGAPKLIDCYFPFQVLIKAVGIVTQSDSVNSINDQVPDGEIFTLYGLTAFAVKYADANNVLQDLFAPVTGNNKVYRKFTGLSQLTNRIQLYMTGSIDGFARVLQLELIGDAPALGGNGSRNLGLDGFGAK